MKRYITLLLTVAIYISCSNEKNVNEESTQIEKPDTNLVHFNAGIKKKNEGHFDISERFFQSIDSSSELFETAQNEIVLLDSLRLAKVKAEKEEIVKKFYEGDSTIVERFNYEERLGIALQFQEAGIKADREADRKDPSYGSQWDRTSQKLRNKYYKEIEEQNSITSKQLDGMVAELYHSRRK